MADDSGTGEGLTRRDAIKYGGAVVGGSVLAGCTSDAEPQGNEPGTETNGGSTAGTGTETGSATTAGDGSYSVTMAPVGEVEFERVPETVFTRLTHHADMAFALGRGDAVNALHAPDYYDGLWNQFVARLPGVSLDWSGLYSSWEVEKEKLYELDSDLHLADPAWVTQLGNWSEADIGEVAENIAPWFGNSLSDRHQAPPAEWADRYEYYGLWEQFEKVAKVFKAEDRYRALATVREEMLSTIEDDLPPDGERPSVAMIAATDLEKEIWAYTLSNPGFLTAHTRPLGPRDAFGGSVESGSTVDFEILLDADPDVVLYLGGMLPGTRMSEIRSTLESDPVASQIAAVKNGRVHPQGARYQGPILNLFQIEMTAKQLHPEQFGAWPEYDDGPYPEIPDGEQLFDRGRVAGVINGEL